VGPTVAIPDAFGDTPIQVSGPSIPNVDYIFLTLRQAEWAQTWESFIVKQDHRVNGPGGYESNDSDYDEEGDNPFFIDVNVDDDDVVSAERVKKKRSAGAKYGRKIGKRSTTSENKRRKQK
jgi:hypothetical protein